LGVITHGDNIAARIQNVRIVLNWPGQGIIVFSATGEQQKENRPKKLHLITPHIAPSFLIYGLYSNGFFFKWEGVNWVT
jgi:hypothetical protein